MNRSLDFLKNVILVDAEGNHSSIVRVRGGESGLDHTEIVTQSSWERSEDLFTIHKIFSSEITDAELEKITYCSVSSLSIIPSPGATSICPVIPPPEEYLYCPWCGGKRHLIRAGSSRKSTVTEVTVQCSTPRCHRSALLTLSTWNKIKNL